MNVVAERIESVNIDSLRLHPDAGRVPMPSQDDLARLKSSLRENGQQDPIDITEGGVILDGRTRWTLLRELGAQTILVRVVAIPDHQQTAWIVDRALARRHLTMAQKQALNELLRGLVIEERVHPPSGQVVQIGLTVDERAGKLGVDRETVKRWDQDKGANAPLSPTHHVDSIGRVKPLHYNRERAPRPPNTLAPTPRDSTKTAAPLRKSRRVPPWTRQVTHWLRNESRPEDHAVLRRLDLEIHDALRASGIEPSCARGSHDNDSAA